MILIYCIIALIVLIFLTLIGIVVYSGLFTTIDVKAGRPPIKNLVIAYKFACGPYQNAGELFTEVVSIAHKNRSIGIYYDHPDEVDTNKLRYCVGTILAEGDEKIDDELLEALIKEGYKLFTLPMVDNSVHTVFPYTTPLSIYLSIWRVYPFLGGFIKENRLSAHPMIEIYTQNEIQFIAPLARQDDFYVPEAEPVIEEVEEDIDGMSDTTGRWSANTTATSMADTFDDHDRTDSTERDDKIDFTERYDKTDFTEKDSLDVSADEDTDGITERKDVSVDEQPSKLDLEASTSAHPEKPFESFQETGNVAESPLSEGLPSFENISSPSESEPELINLSEANSPVDEMNPLITITDESTLLGSASCIVKDQDQCSEKSSSGSSYEELQMVSEDVKQYEEFLAKGGQEELQSDISDHNKAEEEEGHKIDKVED